MREKKPRRHRQDGGLYGDRKVTPAKLKAEQCECDHLSDHHCTDMWLRCRARLGWHIDRGWPERPEATPEQLRRREAYGIKYDARGRMVPGSYEKPTEAAS